MMSFPAAVKKCFKDYVNFRGRSPRAEYWWFLLFTSATFSLLASGESWATSASAWDAANIFYAFSLIFWLGTFLPSLAVSVRRLHDTNRRGWWLLLSIPLILHDVLSFMIGSEAVVEVGQAHILAVACVMPLIVFFTLRGGAGENRFGADPLSGGGKEAG